jgi:putative endonuclease
VFVEVKTRRGTKAGAADESVSDRQADRILSAAEWFLAAHPEHQDRIWRGDIVAISVDPTTGSASARHYVNALVTG